MWAGRCTVCKVFGFVLRHMTQVHLRFHKSHTLTRKSDNGAEEVVFFFLFNLVFSRQWPSLSWRMHVRENTCRSGRTGSLQTRWHTFGDAGWLRTPGAISPGRTISGPPPHPPTPRRIQPSSTNSLSWINNCSFFCLNVVPTSPNTSSTSSDFLT